MKLILLILCILSAAFGMNGPPKDPGEHDADFLPRKSSEELAEDRRKPAQGSRNPALVVPVQPAFPKPKEVRPSKSIPLTLSDDVQLQKQAAQSHKSSTFAPIAVVDLTAEEITSPTIKTKYMLLKTCPRVARSYGSSVILKVLHLVNVLKKFRTRLLKNDYFSLADLFFILHTPVPQTLDDVFLSFQVAYHNYRVFLENIMNDNCETYKVLITVLMRDYGAVSHSGMGVLLDAEGKQIHVVTELKFLLFKAGNTLFHRIKYLPTLTEYAPIPHYTPKKGDSISLAPTHCFQLYYSLLDTIPGLSDFVLSCNDIGNFKLAMKTNAFNRLNILKDVCLTKNSVLVTKGLTPEITLEDFMPIQGTHTGVQPNKYLEDRMIFYIYEHPCASPAEIFHDKAFYVKAVEFLKSQNSDPDFADYWNRIVSSLGLVSLKDISTLQLPGVTFPFPVFSHSDIQQFRREPHHHSVIRYVESDFSPQSLKLSPIHKEFNAYTSEKATQILLLRIFQLDLKTLTVESVFSCLLVHLNFGPNMTNVFYVMHHNIQVMIAFINSDLFGVFYDTLARSNSPYRTHIGAKEGFKALLLDNIGLLQKLIICPCLNLDCSVVPVPTSHDIVLSDTERIKMLFYFAIALFDKHLSISCPADIKTVISLPLTEVSIPVPSNINWKLRLERSTPAFKNNFSILVREFDVIYERCKSFEGHLADSTFSFFHPSPKK